MQTQSHTPIFQPTVETVAAWQRVLEDRIGCAAADERTEFYRARWERTFGVESGFFASLSNAHREALGVSTALRSIGIDPHDITSEVTQ